MATTKLYADTARRDSQWRPVAEALSAFFRDDFRAIDAIRARYYARSHAKRQKMPVPLVSSYAKEIAPHYDRAVARVFTGPRAQQFESFYAAVGANGLLSEAGQRAVAMGTCLCLWMYRGPGDWRPLLIDPANAEVDPDPHSPRSVSAAQEFRFRLPYRTTHDEVEYRIARLNRSENVAVWQHGEPLWPGTGGRLPLGEYPIAVWRVGIPGDGDFFAPLPTHLYHAQIALELTETDINFQRQHSAGQLVGYGLAPEVAQEMDWGPDGIAATESSKEQTSIENVTRDFDAESHRKAIEGYLQSWRRMSGLAPMAFDGSAVTAEAKFIEQQTLREKRSDVEKSLIAGEASFFKSVRVILGWEDGLGQMPLQAQTPSVLFTLPEPPHNPLHTAQANRMTYEDGTSSPVDTVSAALGISRDAALAMVRRNRAEYLEVTNGAERPQPPAQQNPRGRNDDDGDETAPGGDSA